MSALGSPPAETEDPLASLMAMEESLRRAKKEKKDRKERKEEKKGEKKAKDGLGSARGIETMFRTTFQSHNDLVALADNKANMMISVNGVIISILLASVSGGVDQVPWKMLPTIALMVGCIGSMVFGVLAARPRVTRNPVTLEDVRSGRANLLFFGNFLSMPMSDYLEGMRILMGDPDEAYMQMVRNLYALGHILEKKFKLLWMSYTIFLIGLGGAVGLFIVMFARGVASGAILLP